jgi:hypothetical protein
LCLVERNKTSQRPLKFIAASQHSPAVGDAPIFGLPYPIMGNVGAGVGLGGVRQTFDDLFTDFDEQSTPDPRIRAGAPSSLSHRCPWAFVFFSLGDAWIIDLAAARVESENGVECQVHHLAALITADRRSRAMPPACSSPGPKRSR